MSEKYVPIIGIEVHAELKTKTKMFSRSLNNPDEEKPNSIIDPVNMAHPGTLPVINKKAIEHMVRIGLAVGGDIANFTEFDRKNYFYPDIPKGYQISQYKYPIVSNGSLGGVKLTRIHLEEDTGTSKHFSEDGGYSLIDFNRAGVPLMELVTEPVIYSAEDAGKFGKELQLLLRYLGAGDANMEKGEMRVEVNISVLKTDKNPEQLFEMYQNDNDAYMAMLGTKVEVKNINSFSAAEKAAAYELNRMTNLIKEGRGNEIVQETRGWDDPNNKTVSQRAKESAHDYRYFPDPDLPKLYLHELFDLEKEKAGLPELPWEKRVRYGSDYGISDEAIEMFVKDKDLGHYFETIANTLGDKKLITSASNYITSDFVGIQKDNTEAKLPVAESFITLMQMIAAGDLNSRGAKDLLVILATDGGDPKKIAEEKGLIQKNDPEALKKMAQEVIDANPDAVKQYKDGNENIIKFLMGNVMKASKGSANPKMAEEALTALMK